MKLPVEAAAVTADIGLDLRNNAPPDGKSIGECNKDHRFVVYYYEEASFEYLQD